MKKTPNLGERLAAKLVKLGMTRKKAETFAKGLAPLVRAVVRSETVARTEIKTVVPKAEPDEDEDAPRVFTKGKAIKVNGHSLRLDLSVVPMAGIKGIELLRVMDGLCSSATYLVAAVKGEAGIVAVRELGEDHYNVKFYPTMQHWKVDAELLASAYAAESFLTRQWYQRMHFTRDGLNLLLEQLALEAKPKSRMKALVDRFLTVSGRPLLKAFGYLRAKVAA